MAVMLRSTSDVVTTSGVKMLVYGKAGRGKTVLCATCPNPVIFSAESGLLSLSALSLPYSEIKTLADAQDAYRWAASSHEARQFETICIDSLSEIGEVVLSNAKRTVKDPRQAYGELLEKMIDLTKSFRDLPRFHVYISAKEEYAKDSSGAMINGPMMPGQKFGQQLPYLFDEVFQLGIENPPGGVPFRYLRTQPDFSNDAKDRSGRLNVIEEPHLGKIIQKITGR